MQEDKYTYIRDEGEESRSKSRRRKTIKRVVKKRMEDGTLVPIEITKTIIAADGSRSVTREVPEYVKNARAVGNRALSALENKDHITESRKEFQHSKAYRADDGKIILNRTETTNVYQTKIPAKQPNQSKSLN